MSEEFGFYARNALLKVTNEVFKSESLWKIPCSMWFKQRDKTYVNEWVDVLVFPDLFKDAENIQKGDKIKVFGRLTLSEWTSKSGEKKKTWQILASEIRTDKQATTPAPQEEPPF